MSLDVEAGSVRECHDYRDCHDCHDCQEVAKINEPCADAKYTSDTCVICLDEYEPDAKTMNFNCGHIMHIDCTYEWVCSQFRRNTDITCPVCRFVQCHVNSPYYKRLKRELGITTEQSHELPSIINNVDGGLILEIGATRIEIAQQSRQRQQMFIRNQQGMPPTTYRCYGLIMCMFLILLIVFVILVFNSVSDRE